MRGRDHIGMGAGTTAVAIIAAQAMGVAVSPAEFGLAMVTAAAGSLAPDIDHPFSLAGLTIPATLVSYPTVFLAWGWIAHRVPFLAPLDTSALPAVWSSTAWVFLALGVLLFCLSWAAGLVFRHRGPVHSIAFGLGSTVMVVVVLAFLRAPIWVAGPFAWGWLAHLIADSRTAHGLDYVWWPMGHAPHRAVPARDRAGTPPRNGPPAA